MAHQKPELQGKSTARQAFEHYLRTGQRLADRDFERKFAKPERKFNPYHDPRNGQFTFAPGGPRSLQHIIVSDRHRQGANRKPLPNGASSPGGEEDDLFGDLKPAQPARIFDGVYRPAGPGIAPENIQYRPNPRARIGGNGGPRLNDPMTLERVFPGMRAAPGGSILAMADNIFDLTGPANRLTSELSLAHANMLINQIRTVDPNYRFDSLGFPTTAEGQANQIRDLRLDRADAFYRVRGETRPLQVETLRFLQERVDAAYTEGVEHFDAGRLVVRLSREEAIGNYVDRKVRRDLHDLYARYGIATNRGEQVRIIGREYDTSGTDRTYRIPDARIGNIAFDVSLTRKTIRTPQVHGFFNSDFKPDAVVIVRPSQIGSNSTYLISSPRK